MIIYRTKLYPSGNVYERRMMVCRARYKRLINTIKCNDGIITTYSKFRTLGAIREG